MNEADKNLQQAIEDGHKPAGVDAHAFQIVFSALKKEPVYRLPSTFAHRMVDKLTQLKNKKEARRDSFLFGLGIFIMMLTLIVAIVLTDFQFDLGVFTFLAGYKVLVIFGAIFLLFLNWLDARLVKKNRPSL